MHGTLGQPHSLLIRIAFPNTLEPRVKRSGVARKRGRCMLLRLGVSVFLCLFALASTASAEKRVALVVGNSAYENSAQLPNPVNDAQAVAGLFKAVGFEVVNARTNLGNLEFKRALRDFSFAATNADIAVVFFAGHGIEVKGTNYLLPVDAKLAADYDAEDEAVSLNRVIEATETAKRLRLIILDACRDNPFIKTMRRSAASRAVTRGLARVRAGRHRHNYCICRQGWFDRRRWRGGEQPVHGGVAQASDRSGPGRPDCVWACA